MSTAKNIKKKPIKNLEGYTVKFHNNNEILFPKICIICGKNTENQYKKTIFGWLSSNADDIIDYHINIPICNECQKRVKIKNGFSNIIAKLIVVSSIISLIIAIIVYTLIYSVFLSLCVFLFPIIFLYIRYKENILKKIEINDFLNIKLLKDNKTIIFDFLNQNYANFVDEINAKTEPEENDQNT